MLRRWNEYGRWSIIDGDAEADGDDADAANADVVFLFVVFDIVGIGICGVVVDTRQPSTASPTPPLLGAKKEKGAAEAEAPTTKFSTSSVESVSKPEQERRW